MANIIVAAIPTPGHVEPMRAISSDLVERGHCVTFLTGSAFRDAVLRTGARFAALQGKADLTAERLSKVQAEQTALADPVAAIEHGLRTTIVDAVPEQFAALQRILASAEGDNAVLVHEVLFGGAWPLQLGAPGLRPRGVIGVGVFPLALSSRDLGPFGMALPPDSSPEGRARNRAANAQMQAMFAPAQAHLATTLQELGARGEPPFIHDAMVLLPDRFLQLSIEALDYPRSDLPANLRFIGALPRRAAEPFAEPPFWQEVLRAKRVVVVTQGTVANRDFSQLIEPSLRALADSDVLVVATLCRPGQIEHVPENARVAEFIPFEALLPHADVLVSNGGFGASSKRSVTACHWCWPGFPKTRPRLQRGSPGLAQASTSRRRHPMRQAYGVRSMPLWAAASTGCERRSSRANTPRTTPLARSI